MKTILVTGASGRIGQKTVQYFLNLGYNVIGIDVSKSVYVKQLDLSDELKLRNIFKLENPQLIIHLAAISKIEYCELNVKQSNTQNIQNMINLVNICKEYNTILVFFSTNVVFKSSLKSSGK